MRFCSFGAHMWQKYPSRKKINYIHDIGLVQNGWYKYAVIWFQHFSQLKFRPIWASCSLKYPENKKISMFSSSTTTKQTFFEVWACLISTFCLVEIWVFWSSYLPKIPWSDNNWNESFFPKCSPTQPKSMGLLDFNTQNWPWNPDYFPSAIWSGESPMYLAG